MKGKGGHGYPKVDTKVGKQMDRVVGQNGQNVMGQDNVGSVAAPMPVEVVAPSQTSKTAARGWKGAEMPSRQGPGGRCPCRACVVKLRDI